MVLDLNVPHEPGWKALHEVLSVFISYTLSFVLVGLFWYNRHCMFSKVTTIDNYVLWFNMAALFVQSLLPFATAWVGETKFASAPVALYAIVRAFTKIMVIPLVRRLRKLHGIDSEFVKEYQNDIRIYLTLTLDFTSAFVALLGFPKVGFGMLVVGAIVWFFPNTIFNLKRAG